MRSENAVTEVHGEEEFITALGHLLTDPQALAAAKERTGAFVARKAHVIVDVLEQLSPFFQIPENRDAA
jgi:hypothetical protein